MIFTCGPTLDVGLCFYIQFPVFSGGFDVNLAHLRGWDQKLRDVMRIPLVSLDARMVRVLNSRFRGEKNEFEMVFTSLKVLIWVKKSTSVDPINPEKPSDMPGYLF